MTAAQPSPIISAPCGPVRGFGAGSVQRFTGIPYAQADRFQVPAPVEPWSEPFDALEPVPVCPQNRDVLGAELISSHLMDGLKYDEHCQGLSVTRPADIKPDEKLSVMVWFHGGGFVNGAGDSSIYDPTHLVSENRVIVVNVTSRLNLFGYLGDGTTKVANLGLLDVLASLRWVKRNIAAFGGKDDARSITIFGQSAGGSTVSDVMASDEATALFGRVIVQSAPFGIARGRAAMNQGLFEHVKDASPSMSQDEMLALTTKVVDEGHKYGTMGGMPFAPQYGFAPLPDENKLDAILDTHAPKLDILIGHTAEEGSMFISFVPFAAKAARLPFIGSLAHHAFVSWCTSMLYAKGAKSFYDRHVKAGGKASFYTIHWGSKNPRVGATHACELPLLFGKKEAWNDSAMLKGYAWDEVHETGKQLRKVWADFAKGKPVGKEDSVKGVIQIA